MPIAGLTLLNQPFVVLCLSTSDDVRPCLRDFVARLLYPQLGQGKALLRGRIGRRKGPVDLCSAERAYGHDTPWRETRSRIGQPFAATRLSGARGVHRDQNSVFDGYTIAPMDWHPRTTVAAVIERDGRFLMVEELIDGRAVLNQPAGHLEEGESLSQAIVREVLEETAWRFVPEALVGVYRWRIPPEGDTYLRFCFIGSVDDHSPDRGLDEGILGTRWLTRAELQERQAGLRSPLVLRCLDDYLAGSHHPLVLLQEVP